MHKLRSDVLNRVVLNEYQLCLKPDTAHVVVSFPLTHMGFFSIVFPWKIKFLSTQLNRGLPHENSREPPVHFPYVLKPI